MSNDINWTTYYEDLMRDIAESHVQGIRRGYRQGYIDGLKDGIAQERKRMDPVVSDGTRHRSPLCASELRRRRG